MSPESTQPDAAPKRRAAGSPSPAWSACWSWSSSSAAASGAATPARRSSRNGPTRRPSRRSASSPPATRRQQVVARPAGPARGLFARADLCPRQRLPEGLARRYRHAGEGGPAPGRDRGARPRPAAAAGQGRRWPAPRRPRRWPTVTAQRWQQLGGANTRVAPDRRREDRRPHRQAGADQGRAGRRRSPGGARRLQAHRWRRSTAS